MLPKMGLNRHLPLAVVYGPIDNGGLGLPSLTFEQGLQQLQFLAQHLRSPLSPLRTLFQIGIKWLRMIAGYTTCPLFDTHLDLRHVEFAPWFVSVQTFLKSINHLVDIPNLYCPPRNYGLISHWIFAKGTSNYKLMSTVFTGTYGFGN